MAANGGKGVIFVVDDDEGIRDILAFALERQGYTVLTASNGREALDTLSSQTPDLILLDLMMPVMTGWELVAHLRENDQLRRIPVVLMSAYGVGEIQIPSAEFLSKPFEMTDLDRLVTKYCRGGSA